MGYGSYVDLIILDYWMEFIVGIDLIEFENEVVELVDFGVWIIYLIFGRRVFNWLELIVEVGENWEDDMFSLVILFLRND